MLKGLRRLCAGRRGQIAIPALFILPSLFLFVYLIFETAKLSREKIRHQFALDSAAFIEMTNYSDFLNRSAYVNGAFPQRIFYEGFYNTCIQKKNNTQGDCGTAGDRLYNILYKNGAYPRTDQAPPDQPLDDLPAWFLQFGGDGAAKNGGPPDMGSGLLRLITMQNALDYWLSWDDAQDIYKLYVQIYELLGSVEDAQTSVFKRLTTDHNFFRKSYWLNTNDPIDQADEGAAYFPGGSAAVGSFDPKPFCIQQIDIVGNKPTNNPFQPYVQFEPATPVQMPSTIANCQPNSGLFQVEWIKQNELDEMHGSHAPGSRFGLTLPGYPVFQNWGRGVVDHNYFNVNFMNTVSCPGAVSANGPCVHATISLSGGMLWPNPTPKFQTRLYP
ncbi:MAG: Tad domain-containing protein [Elusimicrobia bacterium]|nr:Tad domain-containing protein [Elusimicrobiota bacterium]